MINLTTPVGIGMPVQHPAIERAMHEERAQKKLSVLACLHDVKHALTHKTPEGVVVQFPGRGEGRTKLFRNADHTGPGGALEAARMWRDEQAMKQTEVVEFAGSPSNRIMWGDAELDKLAERAAWLMVMHQESGMPVPMERLRYELSDVWPKIEAGQRMIRARGRTKKR